MTTRVLVIRLMGLGDVLSIGVPGLRLLRARHVGAEFTFMTYGAGVRVLEIVRDSDPSLSILSVPRWPDEFGDALPVFTEHARRIADEHYDVIYNLDTWFMPCAMARMLVDSGENLHGNFLRWSIDEFRAASESGALVEDDAKKHSRYLASTFPRMKDWYQDFWWHHHREERGYPAFYLHHCCGLEGTIDFRLPVEGDASFAKRAHGKRIIAVATEARTKDRCYTRAGELREALAGLGYEVWDASDTTVPLRTTLSRLRVSKLLVTVPSAAQWMGRAVGCPSLVIPGPIDPAHLGAEHAIAATLPCQFCNSSECEANLDFACMQVDPAQIAEEVRRIAAKDLARRRVATFR